MSKKSTKVKLDKSFELRLYEKLIAANPDIQCKGKSMPYTSFNGHMFSFLTEDGTLALRLAEIDRDAFLKKYKTKLCERHGTVMKEYVVVPPKLLKQTKQLQKCFEQSLACIASLKPKSTTR